MIDTTEYYGGTYPSLPKNKKTTYVFTCECSATVERTILAANYDEAVELLNDNKFDDQEIISIKIEDIAKCQKED